jgi:acyl dehydratase
VLFGDTLRAEAEVIDLRPTKHPERLLFVYQNKAYNQRDRQVIEYRTTLMVTKKA